MSRTNQELKKTEGADVAPQGVPEQIRLTLLATVTGRMIELRRWPESIARTYELSRLIPAAEWLTGENGQ
ncbi:hypothetical protein GCM10010082_05700 [Kushneria pakistanensis]|uniref:Uncharacterized protein n=1 Tax=Kushneria pakistanensis TaxID=1508770 RepID=A0ABQ3FBX5_9GAMM|nr:hypothetical protein [Kushneria pakistanensis]GHC17399.1 hypothetical protein GCM10010082_05700 [Kushneria pakistanensis]